MERARRLLPEDDLVGLTLGSVRLAAGDPTGAVALLRPIAERSGGAAAWVALAAAEVAGGDVDRAVQAVGTALRSGVVTPELAGLADRVSTVAGLPGWCGIDAGWRLRIVSRSAHTVLLDGVTFDASEAVERGETIEVSGASGALLGSGLPIGSLRGVQGFVEASEDGLRGWAWHPADPQLVPRLTLRGPGGLCSLVAGPVVDGVEGLWPFARPREIRVGPALIATLGEPIAVMDAEGRHLLGSPLWMAPLMQAQFADLACWSGAVFCSAC